MDLKRQEPTGPRKRWTPEEKEVLRQYSQSELSYEGMREALPERCEQAISSQTKRLGLPQPTMPYWRYLPQSYGLEGDGHRLGHLVKHLPRPGIPAAAAERVFWQADQEDRHVQAPIQTDLWVSHQRSALPQ